MELSANDVITTYSKSRWIFGILTYYVILYFAVTPQNIYFIPGMTLPVIIYVSYYLLRVNDVIFKTEGDNLVVEKQRILLGKEENKFNIDDVNITLTFEEHKEKVRSIFNNREHQSERKKTKTYYQYHLYLGKGRPGGKVMEVLNLTDMYEIFKTKDMEVIDFVEKLSDQIDETPTYKNEVTEVTTDDAREYRESIESFQKQKRRSIILDILQRIVILAIFIGLIGYIVISAGINPL